MQACNNVRGMSIKDVRSLGGKERDLSSADI